MVRGNIDTMVQKLPDLIEWYLSDQGVEVRFVPNERRSGKIAPEFDVQYWLSGRRITERGLAFLVATELGRRNYAFQLSKIIAALTEQAWRAYLSLQEYPDWLANEGHVELKRPVGRPRKGPRLVEDIDQVLDEKASA